MKALLILVAVLISVWLWRNRRDSGASVSTKQPAEPKPQDMVRCHHCGMHIPGNEAVVGKQGSYCSAEHQRLSES
ncbi:PP0621 family protein [Rhodoferax sp.]|uniref:PP0621 family protein n=1 Tax=Rhodoferax sp. TaxID=50421 RepID=UPI002850A2AE|nr:PP0621 family protein [Rhodoferax sp.]MDR3372018.1 PP0621 family protein [Rhodoferax sp.]